MREQHDDLKVAQRTGSARAQHLVGPLDGGMRLRLAQDDERLIQASELLIEVAAARLCL